MSAAKFILTLRWGMALGVLLCAMASCGKADAPDEAKDVGVLFSGGFGGDQTEAFADEIRRRCPRAEVFAAKKFDGYADNFEALIAAHPHKRYYVAVGHSFGTQSIIALAARWEALMAQYQADRPVAARGQLRLLVLLDPVMYQPLGGDMHLPPHAPQVFWFSSGPAHKGIEARHAQILSDDNWASGLFYYQFEADGHNEVPYEGLAVEKTVNEIQALPQNGALALERM